MNKQGFTLVELIFSLFICSFSISLISTALVLVPHILKSDDSLQDEIGITQLRHIALLSESINESMDGLEMIYLSDEITIHQINQRLVKEPGFHILLQDIETCAFSKEDNCYYLTYQKVGVHYENKRFITCT